MRSPTSFDYDLWTTVNRDNGKKQYWVRVKRTGETAEVDLTTMRYLRSEEKRLRRAICDQSESDRALSTDQISEDSTQEEWLRDRYDLQSEVITSVMEQAFTQLLTEKQRDFFYHCMKANVSLRAYAKSRGIGLTTAQDIQASIRKKFRKFYQ